MILYLYIYIYIIYNACACVNACNIYIYFFLAPLLCAAKDINQSEDIFDRTAAAAAATADQRRSSSSSVPRRMAIKIINYINNARSHPNCNTHTHIRARAYYTQSFDVKPIAHKLRNFYTPSLAIFSNALRSVPTLYIYVIYRAFVSTACAHVIYVIKYIYATSPFCSPRGATTDVCVFLLNLEGEKNRFFLKILERIKHNTRIIYKSPIMQYIDHN